MSEVLLCFSPRQRHTRALTREFHNLSQLLRNFNKLNLYKKLSVILIILYEAILKLGPRLKGS